MLQFNKRSVIRSAIKLEMTSTLDGTKGDEIQSTHTPTMAQKRPLTPSLDMKESVDSPKSPTIATRPLDIPEQTVQPPFIDGGARAWHQVIMGFLLMFSSWFVNLPLISPHGPFNLPLAKH